MSLFGTPVTIYPVINVQADATGQSDSTSALIAAQQSLANTSSYGTLQLGAGNFQVNDFPWLPFFHLKGMGKTVTRLFATTALVAVVVAKARLTDYTNFSGWIALGPEISYMTLDANNLTDPRTLAQGGTGNGIHALYAPNAIDDDPNYSLTGDNSKAYSSVRCINMTCHGGGPASTNTVDFPNATGGGGVISMPNRHRFYAEDLFVTACQWHGIKIGGSDPVIGPRTGVGTCGLSGSGYGIACINGAGLVLSAVNCWGTGNTQRNDAALALKVSSCNGVLIVGCIFNDTISLVGQSNQDRSVSVVGNQFRPLSQMFSANGVPYGTGSNDVNCFVYVSGLDYVNIANNDFNLTNNGANTFNYLLNARNGANVAFTYYINSDVTTAERAWANNSNVPYSADTTSFVVGIGIDVSSLNPGIKLSDGSATVGINLGPNNQLDPTVGLQVDHPTNLPARFTVPVLLQDRVCHSYLRKNVANALNQTIPKNIRKMHFDNGGAKVGLNLTFPDNPIDGHSITISCNPISSYTSGVVFIAGLGGATFSPANSPLNGSGTLPSSYAHDWVYSASDNVWNEM